LGGSLSTEIKGFKIHSIIGSNVFGFIEGIKVVLKWEKEKLYVLAHQDLFASENWAARRHKISNIIVAPTREVFPVLSNGGATSTTSPPTRFSPPNP
jgi:hypothetical protein